MNADKQAQVGGEVCPHCKGNPGLDCNSFGRPAPPSAPVEATNVEKLIDSWENVGFGADYIKALRQAVSDDRALAQQPAAVDDEMVQRALSARLPNGDSVRQHITSVWDQTVMRVALTAALAQPQGDST